MRTLIVILVAILANGCGHNDPMSITAQSFDPQMEEAANAARTTLTNFTAALFAPHSNQGYFAVRARLESGGSWQFLWLTQPRFDGEVFQGTIAESPYLKGLSLREVVKVPQSKIVDWMYVEDGKLVGGYSLRLARSRMTDQERRAYDSRIPYRME